MAERIGWDQYETALLIEACEKVNNSLVSKPDVVKKLSASLRERAISQGKKIDEIFRNDRKRNFLANGENELLTI